MTDNGLIEFTAIAQELHQQPTIEATLDSVLRIARETLRSDYAGVMLVHRGNRVETAAVTDDLVLRADQLQFEAGGGPCLGVMESAREIVIDDTRTETRFAEWCRAVEGLGIRSVLSVRLHTNRGTIGALNLYGAEPGLYDREDVDVAAIFAGHASVALAAAQTEHGLRDAMDGRHVIGLAQGILMERFSLNQEQAFSVLRRYSQDRNTKLRAVAEQVVSSRTLPA